MITLFRYYQKVILLIIMMNMQKQSTAVAPLQTTTFSQYMESIMARVGRQNFGLIIMVISQIIWPLTFIFPGERKMNPIQTNLVRSIVTMMTHFFLLRHFDCSFDLKSSHNIRLVVKRNLLICVDNFALTAVLFVLPFPIVFTLNCSCVLFVFMLDYLMFNVKINRQQLWGVTFGFFGVLLTINGEFIIDLLYPEFEKQTEFKNYLTDDPYIKLAAGIAFILVNLSRAYALCITKQMRNVNGLQLSFYVGFILLFECGLLYPSYVSERTSISDMLWSVVFCAIPQNIVQILFLSALVLSKNTGITNLMGFLSIAVSYFVSLVRYNERLNKICLVGVGLICYGIVKTLRNREEHQK